MPKWLSDEQLEDMRQIYLEARRITAETGVKHEVDHIHPIKGLGLCGLHVPWNLQIITLSENKRKSRKLPS
jgi:5-methylcytosine-specific restriction endonuclease McrA